MAGLMPAVTGGKDVLALRCSRVTGQKIERAPGWRAYMFFDDCPHVLWLNGYSVANLKARLGPTRDAWVGHVIPIVRVRNKNPRTGHYVDAYQVADPRDWSDVIEQAAREGARAVE